jgi:hypothetical protein
MADDKAQIGLTPEGSSALSDLVHRGIFGSEGDGYKVAVAYALAVGMSPDAAPQKGFTTKFNAAGGLDRDGTLREVVTLLAPGGDERPYAVAEKLADLGVKALHARILQNESMADILLQLAKPAAN